MAGNKFLQIPQTQSDITSVQSVTSVGRETLLQTPPVEMNDQECQVVILGDSNRFMNAPSVSDVVYTAGNPVQNCTLDYGTYGNGSIEKDPVFRSSPAGNITMEDIARWNGLAGGITGPPSSGDDNIVLFSGITGTILKDSNTKLTDLALVGHLHDDIYQPIGDYLVAADIENKVDKITGFSLVDDDLIAYIHAPGSDDETTNSIKSKLGPATNINDGYLTAADFNIFNNKQPAGNYAPALGTDDNYVTDAEKAALHAHLNLSALDLISGVNTGDNAVNTTANAYADSKVADVIVNNVTNVAPSQNAVFDALAGKQPIGNYSTDIHANIVALNAVSGVNTGDQDLSGYALSTHNHTGVYAPVLGPDDNYVTDAEKLALHSHLNKTALDNVSGVNTGDQNLSGLVPYTGATGSVNLGANDLTGNLITSRLSQYGTEASFIAYSTASNFPRATFQIGQSAADTNVGMYFLPKYSSPGSNKKMFFGGGNNVVTTDSGYRGLLFNVDTDGSANIYTVGPSNSGQGGSLAISTTTARQTDLVISTSGDVTLGQTLNVTGIYKKGGSELFTTPLVSGSAGTNGQVLTSTGSTTAPTWQDLNLTGYVPYTGATTNVNLGSNSIKAAKFQLKTDAVNTLATGEFGWNEHDKTANLKSGEVTLQLNQEQVLPIKNVSGSTLLNGRLVRVTGHEEITEYYTVEYSDNSSEATAFVDFMLTQDLADGEVGLGTKTGIIHDINTTGGTMAQPIFLGTNGQFIFSPPTYPSRTVLVGICGHVDAVVGEVFVDLGRGAQYSINTINNELTLKGIQNPGICQRCPILVNDIVIDTTARTLTIATVKGGEAITPANPIRFFTDGGGVIKLWEIPNPVTFPAWTDTTGVWYFYFDNTGTAITTQVAWSNFNTIATVYRLYWNATLAGSARVVIEALETHLNDISASDHAWKHAQGSIHENGLEITHNFLATGAPNADGRNTCISLSTGKCSDDGLEWTVVNTYPASPVNYFEQDMGNTTAASLTSTNSGLFQVRSNDAGGLLTLLPATRFPFLWNTGNNRPQYLTTTGVATDVPDDNFFVYYVYNLADRPAGRTIKLASAPVVFATLPLAQAHNWESMRAAFATLKDNELRPLYKLIFLVNHSGGGSYSASCKYTVLREVADIRTQKTTTSVASSGSTLASNVVFSPGGDLSSTNVQSALLELDAEKQPIGTYSTDIHANIAALNAVSGVNTGDQNLSGLVPYTGATGNVNLGSNSLTTTKIIGGSSTSSDLYLQTTSGVGATGADMHFLVGNNGGTEAMTIFNDGSITMGSPASVIPLKLLVADTAQKTTLGQSEVLRLAQGFGSTTVGNKTEIGFFPSNSFNSPVVIGSETKSSSNFTNADLYIATRLDTNNTTALERLRVTAAGKIIISDLVSGDTTLVTASTLGQLGTISTTSFAPATGSTNYIQNQTASMQTASMWVTDKVRSNYGLDIYKVPDPTAPSGVVSAGGSVDIGDHWYSVSYITAIGETHTVYTNAVITTTPGNNTVTLTIPTSTDPRVTGRKIYRTKASGTYNYQDYYLATVYNNTETSYIDTASDSTLSGSAGQGYFRTNSTSEGITVNGERAFLLDSNGTYIGVNAGVSISSGGRNVFIGQEAGQNVTTASDVVAIGHQAGGSSTMTGNGNTLIGSYTGRMLTWGSNNTIVGYTAFSLGTGYGNVALGSYALANMTTGYNNIALGYTAGEVISDGVTANETSFQSIYLGINTKPSANGNSNEIVVGYNTSGNGSNTTTIGNPNTLRTYLPGVNLKAGTTSAGTAPLKFTSGLLLATPEVGAIEFNNDAYYGTITTGPSRRQFAFIDNLPVKATFTEITTGTDDAKYITSKALKDSEYLERGAFGLGSTDMWGGALSERSIVNDANLATTTGFFVLDGPVSNSPINSGSGWGYLIVMCEGADFLSQIFIGYSISGLNGSMYIRVKDSNVWGQWRKVMHGDDKATAAELNTGTEDTKFATAKGLKDGEFIGIHVGTTAPADTTKLWLDTN